MMSCCKKSEQSNETRPTTVYRKTGAPSDVLQLWHRELKTCGMWCAYGAIIHMPNFQSSWHMLCQGPLKLNVGRQSNRPNLPSERKKCQTQKVSIAIAKLQLVQS